MGMCTEFTFDYEAVTKQMDKPAFFSDRVVASVKKKYDDYYEAFLDNVFGHDCKLDKQIFVSSLVEKEQWILDPLLVR